MSLMTASESWRAIRTIRAEPQGPLSSTIRRDRARHREFHMALEQAQQQFAAAALIGYESRPLNLFYGLSQAGRAISAGSDRLGAGTGQQWQATGHGLKFDVSTPNGIFETPVRQDGISRDLFSRVSVAIGSPLDFSAIAFGAAVNQLIDYTMTFQDLGSFPRPITDTHVYNYRSATFPMDVEILIPGIVDRASATPAQVRAHFDPYPALEGLDVAVDEAGGVRWSHNDGRCFLVLPSAECLTARGADGTAVIAGTSYYRRTAVLLPRAGSSTRSLSPLMSWWVVLYALSMLARYAPSNWTETLSLAESPIASRIEFLLDAALDAVPELLWGELYRLGDAQAE